MRGTIVIFIVAFFVMAGIYYFTREGSIAELFDTDGSNKEQTETWTCRDECVKQGHFRGECVKGDSSLKYQKVCIDRGGVEMTDRSIKLDDCDFKTVAAWEVCCCFGKNDPFEVEN